ncbi:MAG: hypothetical protein K0R73_1031 [Candidatus Midichloriaceae bacterium]|jgi:hypothetical protein|nr:hypothetical protein [Candidatus Midichloriaceae bacterium]
MLEKAFFRIIAALQFLYTYITNGGYKMKRRCDAQINFYKPIAQALDAGYKAYLYFGYSGPIIRNALADSPKDVRRIIMSWMEGDCKFSRDLKVLGVFHETYVLATNNIFMAQRSCEVLNGDETDEINLFNYYRSKFLFSTAIKLSIMTAFALTLTAFAGKFNAPIFVEAYTYTCAGLVVATKNYFEFKSAIRARINSLLPSNYAEEDQLTIL